MTLNRPFAIAGTAGLALLSLAANSGHAIAADSITVGRPMETSLYYLPTYIAVDKGIFREEGLDVKFVVRDDTALTASGISGAIDFVPDAGGPRVSIKGAAIRYVVGQSRVSPWVIVANPNSVKAVEDLKGRTLGFGKPGSADYEEGAFVLRQLFQMVQGRDYTVVSIPNEPERLAALVEGRVQAASMSIRQAAIAGIEGYDIVLKSGHYLPRLDGTYWVTAAYLEKNPDIVRRFIRAIARSTRYLATDQIGSLDVIEKHFGTSSPAEANVLWNAVRKDFDPAVSAPLLREKFKESLARLRRKGLWPRSRPMPAIEQFIARDVTKSALGEIGY